ncbi:MAG: pentapeptide repeat-containing protein [Moorea sp. SIO3G5]|nr:pentapeptide repeat-containing protein [Moorena sp. SIO3G5]
MKLNQILNQIKLYLSPSSTKTDYQKVQEIAYQLYQNRLLVKGEGDAEQDWHKAEQIVKNPLKLALFKCHQPFISIEKKFLEPVLDYLNRLALLEILGLVGNLSLLVGVIVFLAGEQDRRNAEVYQAWQVVTAAYDQAGSGGRKEALEFLNSEPRRIPWFWLTWRRQSLEGLEAPKAYLRGVQLSDAELVNANLQQANLFAANLQKANLYAAKLQKADLSKANLKDARLYRANLQGASLSEAQLQKARLYRANLQQAILDAANLHNASLLVTNLQQSYLEEANLQKAILFKADLSGADLSGADLQKARLSRTNLQEADLSGANLKETDLSRANLQDALYSDETTSEAACEILFIHYPCPTIFPEGFDPKAAGMKLIKKEEDIPKRYSN